MHWIFQLFTPGMRAFGQAEAKAQENFTDPQSRLMKTSSGFEQCYNAQAAVDESGLVVATEVIDAGNDIHHLVPRREPRGTTWAPCQR